MRLVPLLSLILPLTLGGCAVAGLAPAAVEAVRETAAMSGLYSGEHFAPAAEQACRARASRHGRVEITSAEPDGLDRMRIYGTIDRFAGSEGRTFSCVFRKDGHIGYFKIT